VRYYGQLDVESLSDWINRKIAVSNNRITDLDQLKAKISKTDLLVIFAAPRNQADAEFRAYLKCAQ
jgi:hypothetical protein